MPARFSDIMLYLPRSPVDGMLPVTCQGKAERYISDLYCRCMNDYKPPHCTRITIQPAFYGIWKHARRDGSVISIAPFFDRQAFDILNKAGQYLCLLNLIEECTQQLSKTYQWNPAVFENAYRMVLTKHFLFQFDYPPVLSRDRKIQAFLSIEKTEQHSMVYANILVDGGSVKIKLYQKTNHFWHDCSYVLVRHARWFDADRFGIDYPKGRLLIWHSMSKNELTCIQDERPVEKIDFKKIFWMQPD